MISLAVLAIFVQDHALAKEVLNLGANSEVQILSDKAFHKSSENTYEAHGNVIIKLKTDSIYGEKASLTPSSAKVWGNVRYVGPQITLYGTEIDFSIKDAKMTVHDAKLVDQNFTIFGKKIVRYADGHLEAEDAEYSTCRDCPGSWSVQGGEVRIIPDQYVYMKHAFIKIKGVTIVYIPYIVFPIKKDRETGLLFPKLGFDLERGFYLQQPFFWAINQSSDLTLSPTSYGQRGLGLEWEYRKAINNNSDFKFYNLQSFDQVWAPGKINEDKLGDRKLRQFYDYDFFYKPSNDRTFFVEGKQLSDLDILSDYNVYIEKRLLNNEHGHKVGFQEVFPNFFFGVEGNFMNNAFFANAKGFDHSYVQNLGHLEMSHTPINFLQSSGLISKISFDQNLDLAYFKQNHVGEGQYLRNVQRLDYRPSVWMKLRPFGPVNFEATYKFDYQHYNIPHEVSGSQTARKYGSQIKTSLWMEVEKTFGRPYIETKNAQKVEIVENKSDLISPVPNIKEESKQQRIAHSSYKHLITYGLNHSYYEDQKISGNENLVTSLLDGTNNARFDYRDQIGGRDQNVFDVATRTDLPESNSIELVWKNSLLKKTPKLDISPFENFRYNLDNFDYSKIAYFDLSQGVLLNSNDDPEFDFEDRLTRLHASFGISVGDFSLSGSEFYFHQSGEHISNFNLKYAKKYFNYSVSYIYDSFSSQRRYTKHDLKFRLSDMIELRTGHYYDFEKKSVYESYVGGIYVPKNNCWKLDIEYRQKDQIKNNDLTKDQIISFNFLLNYNAKTFGSLFGIQL